MNVPGYSTTATKLCESRAGRVARALACLALSGALSSTGGAWGAGVPAKTSATAATIAEGTILHLRLQTTVSTMTSKKGQPVAAVIAREVIAQGGVAVPVGATLKGSIEKCSNPSQADERAELLLNFTELDIPGEGNLKLSGHVSGVGNARETLLADGTIVGVLKTEAPVTLLGGVLQKLGDSNPTIAKEIQKQKIGEVNTAIDLPAGTDLQFTLAQPLSVPQLVSVASSKRLPSDLSAFLASFLSEAPQRSVSKDNKPGDPINLIVVGRSQEIAQAFRQAGWSEPKRRDGQSILETARAVMNNEGYGADLRSLCVPAQTGPGLREDAQHVQQAPPPPPVADAGARARWTACVGGRRHPRYRPRHPSWSCIARHRSGPGRRARPGECRLRVYPGRR